MENLTPNTTVLGEICARKREHVAACRAARSLAELEQLAQQASPARGFIDALVAHIASGRAGLIAELKKASPSKGLIRNDFKPSELAKAYAAGGASCLSVLTDMPYFQGEDVFLQQARAAVNIPALRKDFMLESYQIIESRALGADAILLIMAALSDSQAQELEATAHAWGMDVLIEVHDATELERALCLTSRLIGINNRNLKTLDVSLDTTRTLAPMVPTDKILVCESGIRTHTDIVAMQNIGAHAFLVGESLMLQADVTQATQYLLGISK